MSIIKTDNLYKKYCLDLKTSLKYGVVDLCKELINSDTEKQLRNKEFWALEDISISVDKGECIGLIGENGAGKSTLLKILNGLIKPDKGRVEIRGKVGALIELGAGFLPVLTGRENIFMNASILGISKSNIKKKLDEIIDFSGVEKFIDAPVQSYSTGMKIRLGFSIALQMSPDVLLVDEALAVGDLSFRMKSLRKLRELIEDGLSIIFVSHNLEQVKNVCNRACWVEQGKLIMEGNVTDVCTQYEKQNLSRLSTSPNASEVAGSTIFKDSLNRAEIIEVFSNTGPLNKPENPADGGIHLQIKISINSKLKSLFFSFGIRTIEQKLVYGNIIDISDYAEKKGNFIVNIEINRDRLLNGIYLFSCGLHSDKHWGSQIHVVRDVVDIVIETRPSNINGIVNIEPEININGKILDDR
jgi:lipopolysaccharide transport system ATP-binding protein